MNAACIQGHSPGPVPAHTPATASASTQSARTILPQGRFAPPVIEEPIMHPIMSPRAHRPHEFAHKHVSPFLDSLLHLRQNEPKTSLKRFVFSFPDLLVCQTGNLHFSRSSILDKSTITLTQICHLILPIVHGVITFPSIEGLNNSGFSTDLVVTRKHMYYKIAKCSMIILHICLSQHPLEKALRIP